MDNKIENPTNAFVMTSWAALALGVLAYLIGLWNLDVELRDKGYYFTVFIFGLYAAVSVQKTVRDKMENIPVSGIFYGISWVGMAAALILFGISVYNTDLMIASEKGFYSMAFALSLFAAVVVQKNVRDQLSSQNIKNYS
jgi:uncharacterized membrane protein YiaA